MLPKALGWGIWTVFIQVNTVAVVIGCRSCTGVSQNKSLKNNYIF